MSKKFKKAKESTLRTIKDAMEAVQATGTQIQAGTWGAAFDARKGYFVNEGAQNGNGTNFPVCALGALLIHKNGSFKFDAMRGRKPLTDLEEADAAAIVLGVDKNWVQNFIEGFDGANPSVDCKPIMHDDMTSKQRYDYDRTARASDCTGADFIFPKTRSASVKEFRRAYKMGEKLRKEFVK